MTERRAALIKRIRLATARAGLERGDFTRRWRGALTTAAAAPGRARPARISVATTLPDIAPDQKYDGVGMEWFTDEQHLLRYEAWLGSPDGAAHGTLLGEAIDADASPVIVADERVARGADWLERRWRQGGPKLKQLAIATRAPGLTLPEFLDLWRGHAGKVGATPIPEAYRGLAYLQNHPRVMPGRGWAYDAVNEVYFDDEASLRARTAYFDRELPGPAADDLFGANWFLAVREEPVEFTRKG